MASKTYPECFYLCCSLWYEAFVILGEEQWLILLLTCTGRHLCLLRPRKSRLTVSGLSQVSCYPFYGSTNSKWDTTAWASTLFLSSEKGILQRGRWTDLLFVPVEYYSLMNSGLITPRNTYPLILEYSTPYVWNHTLKIFKMRAGVL